MTALAVQAVLIPCGWAAPVPGPLVCGPLVRGPSDGALRACSAVRGSLGLGAHRTARGCLGLRAGRAPLGGLGLRAAGAPLRRLGLRASGMARCDLGLGTGCSRRIRSALRPGLPSGAGLCLASRAVTSVGTWRAEGTRWPGIDELGRGRDGRHRAARGHRRRVAEPTPSRPLVAALHRNVRALRAGVPRIRPLAPRPRRCRGEPVRVTHRAKPAGVPHSAETTRVTHGVEPTGVTHGVKPAGVAGCVEPARITRRWEPTGITRRWEPARIAHGREPARLTRRREPTGITRRAEPARIAHGREPARLTYRWEITGIAYRIETVGAADAAVVAGGGGAPEPACIPPIARSVELVAGDFCGGLRARKAQRARIIGPHAGLPARPGIATRRRLRTRKAGTLSVPCPAIATPPPATHVCLPVQSLGAGPGIQPMDLYSLAPIVPG